MSIRAVMCRPSVWRWPVTGLITTPKTSAWAGCPAPILSNRAERIDHLAHARPSRSSGFRELRRHIRSEGNLDQVIHIILIVYQPISLATKCHGHADFHSSRLWLSLRGQFAMGVPTLSVHGSGRIPKKPGGPRIALLRSLIWRAEKTRMPAESLKRGAASDHCARRGWIFCQQRAGDIERLALASAARTRQSREWNHNSKNGSAAENLT